MWVRMISLMLSFLFNYNFPTATSTQHNRQTFPNFPPTHVQYSTVLFSALSLLLLQNCETEEISTVGEADQTFGIICLRPIPHRPLYEKKTKEMQLAVTLGPSSSSERVKDNTACCMTYHAILYNE